MSHFHHNKSVCIKTPHLGFTRTLRLCCVDIKDLCGLCALSLVAQLEGAPADRPASRAALPARAVELAPLQLDLGHVLPQAHEQDTLAMEDLQAPDGLPPPLGEEFNFFQHTAARALGQRCPHLFDGAIICKDNREERKWGQQVSQVTGQLSSHGSPPAWLHRESSEGFENAGAWVPTQPWWVRPAGCGRRHQSFYSCQQAWPARPRKRGTPLPSVLGQV